LEIACERIRPDQLRRAREAFLLLARVFEEPHENIGDSYCRSLLGDSRFRAFTATEGDAIVGALTAWVLPLTYRQERELMIYDLAVETSHQRRGIGRLLVGSVLAQAKRDGIDVAWVPAANEDAHALDFYRAVGGKAESTTVFVFGE
jgi:aminoglycoside 3-N-acetyltransferase I